MKEHCTRTRVHLTGTLATGFLLLVLMAGIASATSITFRYQPVIGGVSSVSVAGDFNGWNTTANPLTDDNKDGVWEAKLDLPPGKILYKFVVNGSNWFTDESAADFVSDGLGGQNSVLVIKDQPLVAGFGTTVKKASPAAMGLRNVTFKFKPDSKPQSLCVAGSFNDWTVGKSPMTDPDGDGVYTANLLLAPGAYQYKFVVNGNGWTEDKAGEDGNSDDGFGGKNSILNVDDRFKAIDVKVGDGKIFEDGVTHEQTASEVNNLGAGRAQFTARAHRSDVESVGLVVHSATGNTTIAMPRINQDKVFEYFRAETTLPAGASYEFAYKDGPKTSYLTRKGFSDTPGHDLFAWDASKFPPFLTPDWVKNAVIYQIFPDRFRNGNKSNDQDFKEWYYQGKHGDPPSGKIDPDRTEYYHLVTDWANSAALTQCAWTPDGRDWMAFYGGDIEGVRQSLAYLKDLGVTVIYLNPIFEAKSTHKYDGADYKKVDPHFGTNEEFKAFVKEAKAQGIRVVLDIVYNHSGNAHYAFKEAVEKGKDSPYYDWYEFTRWPLPEGWPNVKSAWKPSDYYKCWWGFGDLPDLNFDLSRPDPAENAVKNIADAKPNWPLVNHLLDATEFWLKEMDADGVRLDVPNEVPDWFWKLYNERVKKVKPDAYIVAELWGNATDHVGPGMYDAVMNYAFFRDPVNKFIGKGQGSAEDFDASLATGRLTYPSQATQVMMNLIDSHDTVRFLTDNGNDLGRLKLAALFGLTYVGAPCIYYGDEIGMAGGRDPDCRRPFLWDWQKDPQRVDVHDWYRKLANLRGAHAALRTGDFRTVQASGMTYAYLRSDGREDFLVAINAGRQAGEVTLDTAPWGGKVTATDGVTGISETWTGIASIKLSPGSGQVFQVARAR